MSDRGEMLRPFGVVFVGNQQPATGLRTGRKALEVFRDPMPTRTQRVEIPSGLEREKSGMLGTQHGVSVSILERNPPQQLNSQSVDRFVGLHPSQLEKVPHLFRFL